MLALLPPAVPKTFRQLAFWLEPRKVPVSIVSAVLMLVGLVALGSSRLNMQASLFDVALHPSQTAEVERALLLWNEPFSTDAQHTQVYVSESRRRDVLLRLALAGVPHRYVPTTSDVMEQQQSAFEPQSVMDDRRRAGIEGDLVMSLRRMNGVSDASVVIAPASSDPLAADDSRTPASASVQMLMQPGAALTAAQLAGIKRFVAASYPGLSAERVVIVDAGGADNAASAPPETVSARQAGLQNSIQSALDAVFGPGVAVVRVSMRTSDEERTEQSTLVTPHGLLEAERGSENGSESGKNFTREKTHTRYAYDTVVETRTAHADALARLSVAVFVDSKKVSLAQSKLITDVVRAAAGAQLGSDQVVIAALPFRAQMVSASHTSAHPIRLRTVIAFLALTLALACGWGFWVRRAPRDAADEQTAKTLQASLQNEMPQTAAYVLGTLPQGVRERVLRAYGTQQRLAIMAHMNGRAHR
jgi:flagellar biosynthesis/type III secretory pathway M-ring protein FliF/YscJ